LAFVLLHRGLVSAGIAFAQAAQRVKEISMPRVAARDGTEIYYRDWGKGPPIVFSHGWPLTGAAWKAQKLFFNS
jgi:non-heme chloroperoxidase